MNKIQQLRIEKITLNIGAGTDQKLLEKGMKLIKNLTGISPIKTKTLKRIPAWGLRPNLPIGCKLTLRGEKAIEILKRLIVAKKNVLKSSKNCPQSRRALHNPSIAGSNARITNTTIFVVASD